MSTLVAIAYPEQGRAREVMDILKQLQAQHLIELDDAVAVVKDDEGKIKLDQAVNLTGAGAAGGALWGMLIGLLFLSPLFGAAVGAATGALVSKASDYGVDDNFAQQLGSQLRPGSSALLVLVRQATPDKVLAEIGKYGGTVMQTSLPNDAERRLQAALSVGGAVTSRH
jgi:uncharacterized membrane protein